MCTSPSRIFATGLKTDSGKGLYYFDSHYPCPDVISIERAEKQLKVHIPYNREYMEFINGHRIDQLRE